LTDETWNHGENKNASAVISGTSNYQLKVILVFKEDLKNKIAVPLNK
jgi:hypothetical protein